MSNKKHALPFDKRGGVLAINRRMFNSEAYTGLKPPAKVLLLLLQEQWRNERLVSFGVREAAKKIPCNIKTAAKCFNALQTAGFIYCARESLFNSRVGSRARDWKLTWLPYMDRPPTNEWEKGGVEIKPTVPN